MDLTQELEEYIDILLNKEEGRPGRDYLKFRGIEISTAVYWKIGYCPLNYIATPYRNSDINWGEKMGGRITFPIFDANGLLVSISGRLALSLDKPKYDMYNFIKKRVLFGLHQNKNNIREQNSIIITEGQLDVISAWQNGITNVASSFGAHCSLYHLGLAARYCSDIYILYDEDMAGLSGAEDIKDFSTCGDLNVFIKTGIFPKGEDLDSFLKKHSKDELEMLLNII